MREHGFIAHNREASHWIYLSDLLVLPNKDEYKKQPEDYTGGSSSFEEPTTANPFGFNEGY